MTKAACCVKSLQKLCPSYTPTKVLELQELTPQICGTWQVVVILGSCIRLACLIVKLYRGYIGIMEKKMETTIIYRGYIGIMEKKMETTIIYWGNIGIMEKKMETTIIYWGNIGIMEKKMETTIIYWGNIGIMEKKMETTI